MEPTTSTKITCWQKVSTLDTFWKHNSLLIVITRISEVNRTLVSPSWIDRNGQCAVNIIFFFLRQSGHLDLLLRLQKRKFNMDVFLQRKANLFLSIRLSLTVWEQASSSSYLRKNPGFPAWCHVIKNFTLVSHSPVQFIKSKFSQLAPEKWSFHQTPMATDMPGST